MSEYSDYIVDFPRRCLEILENYKFDAESKDLEVTLTLMAATSSFVVPMGQLDYASPTQDYTKLGERISIFNKEFGRRWADSSISKDIHAWLYGEVEEIGNGTDEWKSPREKVDDKDVRQILTIIRNALAH